MNLDKLNPGGMQPADGDWLRKYALVWGGPVFEIGVEYGNSTAYIYRGLLDRRNRGLQLRGEKLIIFSVDVQDVRDVAIPRQVFYRARSVDVVPPLQCRWAFIDGDHTRAGVRADILHCQKLGIERMILHDARQGDPTDGKNTQLGTDVYVAAMETFDEKWNLHVIDTPCGLLIASKQCLS